MAALLTLKDLYDTILERAGQSTSDTTLIGFVTDWLNIRYKEICSLSTEWPFLTDHDILAAIDEYTTGTVDITTDTAAVKGSSTVWTKDMADRKIHFDDEEPTIRIANVSSATAITLAASYHGTTVDDGTYTIFKDEYLCPITWEDIISMRAMREGRTLGKVGYRELFEEHPNPYASSSDPDRFAVFETRKLTKIGVDGYNLTYTIADIDKDHWFSGANGAYGWVKNAGTDAASNDYLVLQILYGSLVDNEKLTFYSDVATTATGVTCLVNQASYTEGNVGDVLGVILNPAPYRNTLYECVVRLKPVDMSLTTDEPLIPQSYRDILFYLGLADLYGYLDKTDKMQYFEAKGLGRLNQMAARLKVRLGNRPRIRPAYKRRAYA